MRRSAGALTGSDVKGFGADFAYTADGGPVGEIEYENFNAAGAKVVVHGLNIHPGSAKGKMVNSQLIAMEFQSLLPVGQRPELTEGYEGFFHLLGMKGEVERSELHYIIRDHDMEKFEEKKAVMTCCRGLYQPQVRRGNAGADPQGQLL